MKNHGPIAKSFAIVLAVAVVLSVGPQVSAADKATLEGTIFTADGEALVDGAILHAGNLRTGDIYSSAKTGSDGEFVIADLPPAVYELAIERNGGLYIAGSSVQLSPGEQREVNLALEDDEDDDDGGLAPDPATANKVKRGFWDKPWFATLVVVGGAFAVGALISAVDDDSDDLPSPFGPN